MSNINNNWMVRYLYELDNRNYPQSICRLVNHINDIDYIISGLDELRGKCQPVAMLTTSFEAVMRKSYKKFFPLYNSIIQELESEAGVIASPYWSNNIDKGYIVYQIKNGSLSITLFHADKNEHFETVHIPIYKCEIEGITLVDGVWGCNCSFCALPIARLGSQRVQEEFLWNIIVYVLQYLCLRKWADVEIAEVHTEVKKQVKVKKKTRMVKEDGLMYLTYDKRWFTEVCNDNEFKVSGHFRLQPYGDGSKKLIYIDDFIKHGYHRKALIEKAQGSKR